MPPTFGMSDNSHATFADGWDRQKCIIAGTGEITRAIGTICLSLYAAGLAAVMLGCIVVQRIIKPR